MLKKYLFCCFLFLSMLSTGAMAKNYFTLDNKAKFLPFSEAETPQMLVKNLTGSLTNDVDKARILAAWMVYQMQRDGYRHKELIKYSNRGFKAPPPLQNDPFKTRIGTPQEFAVLYQQLCQMAGLETIVINGYAGWNIPKTNPLQPVVNAAGMILGYIPTNFDLQRYEAAWNAVKLDGEWQLIDTYWMIANPKLMEGQDYSSRRSMEAYLKRRTINPPSLNRLTQSKRIDNDYFMANPHQFIKSHFPSDVTWQLLPVPTTWAVFTD